MQLHKNRETSLYTNELTPTWILAKSPVLETEHQHNYCGIKIINYIFFFKCTRVAQSWF